MRVLVAHASKKGGTTELAEWVGSELEDHGLDIEVRPAKDVKSVARYEAVVLGGALYAFMWHKDAKRFVSRNQRALRDRPVWLFSSGPLDDSATETEIPPVRFVRRAIQRIGARGHKTFGGRLTPDYKGPLPVGDWRDRSQVEEWAAHIAAELRGAKTGRTIEET